MAEPKTRFDAFFTKEYGARWAGLRRALLEAPPRVVRLNGFACLPDARVSIKDFECTPIAPSIDDGPGAEDVRHTILQRCFACPFPPGPSMVIADDEHQPPRGGFQVMNIYNMDFASILCALAVDCRPGHSVLDMCSAPGGKALLLFEMIKGVGTLVCNEPAKERRERLQKVLREYIPNKLNRNYRCVGVEGTKWCNNCLTSNIPIHYDRILLDAPCSSDRHAMHDAVQFQSWSESRPLANAKRQTKLLTEALRSLQRKGRLIYSTCALSVMENDEVIEKTLDSLKGRGYQRFALERELFADAQLRELLAEYGDQTRCGWIVLPDKGKGYGPLYMACIVRCDEKDDSDSEEEGEEGQEDASEGDPDD